MFGVYLACKLLYTYGVGPAWNFVDALASKKAQRMSIDWAWLAFAGSLASAVAPVITGLLKFIS